MQSQLPTLDTITVIAAGCLNLGGFIWAAARITSKLDNLIESFKGYKESTDKEIASIKTTQADHITKVAVMWDRRGGPVDRRSNVDSSSDP